MTIAKAGTLLCVDEGKYSSYKVIGFFVVLRDFEPKAELEELFTANPEFKEGYNFEGAAFLAALIAKGLLLEVAYSTLYMGEYRDADTVKFTPADLPSWVPAPGQFVSLDLPPDKS